MHVRSPLKNKNKRREEIKVKQNSLQHPKIKTELGAAIKDLEFNLESLRN